MREGQRTSSPLLRHLQTQRLILGLHACQYGGHLHASGHVYGQLLMTSRRLQPCVRLRLNVSHLDSRHQHTQRDSEWIRGRLLGREYLEEQVRRSQLQLIRVVGQGLHNDGSNQQFPALFFNKLEDLVLLLR